MYTRKYSIHHIIGLLSFLISSLLPSAVAQTTEKLYLSGTGSDHTVAWDFKCSAGMNSGKWSTIQVPSCWEHQGFGKYDYGFAKDSLRGKEVGSYRHRFHVPSSWKGKVIYIVFEGVMTDADVRVNGKRAGPVHQGAFYAFRYDISSMLKYGRENLLEVDVAKHSANASVNEAERKADFWIFGGIFRPVWLEAVPQVHVREVAIDAGADGRFKASFRFGGSFDSVALRVYASDGHPLLQKTRIISGIDGLHGTLSASFESPALWTAESPDLHHAQISLYAKGRLQHSINQKFGFRTIEVRQRDGVYINGVRIKLKGVNRHSFRPETGRTTSKAVSIEDVLLIKEMNMNAVRMSHYPPDGHFLDMCDSLGLYVMDELSGWHGHYDTPTGSMLLKEMITHDVNHPSIILWANGNEGGHNTDLDPLFRRFDIQQRAVLHPWQQFGGFDTQHYREYNYGIGNYDQGRDIVLPTEFLHGQFDGGHGAGLEDYWEKMWRDPLSAGGFLWDFADNAVVRKDMNDSLDTDKHRAADGILGPHMEKEGSFYAIREIFSPVHIERREIVEDFNGRFAIENRYHFTNIRDCRFSWMLKKWDANASMEQSGGAISPDIPPHARGFLQLDLPKDWSGYDVLYLTACDPFGKELFTWSYPITDTRRITSRMVTTDGAGQVDLRLEDSLFRISVGEMKMDLHRTHGRLVRVSNKNGIIPLADGPVIQEGLNNFGVFDHRFEGRNLIIESAFNRSLHFNTLQWTVYPSGWVRMEVRYFPSAYFTSMVGVNFTFPESMIRTVTYMGDGPYRVWKNRMRGNKFGMWTKEYNNTETGEFPWVYPEFKGYHSRFHAGHFQMADDRFTVVSGTEGIFMRLFTPAWKTDPWRNYEPIFPKGDISFMHGITSIGSKTQRNVTTGPMGGEHIFYDYEKSPERHLVMVLYFNFNGK